MKRAGCASRRSEASWWRLPPMIVAGVALVSLAGTGCGGPDPAQATVATIVEDLMAQRYGQASSRYRAAEEEVLSPAAAPAWRRALENEDPTVREWAVDALSRIGEPEDLPRLVVALDDPFRKVQEAAAQGLIRMDEEAARQAFLERLERRDPDALVTAAQGLVGLGDRTAVPQLVRLLQDPEVPAGVRGVVAQALGDLGDPWAAEPLAGLALDPAADLQLRRLAAEALAVLEGPEARRALQRLREADDAYVREVARRALG